MKTVFKNTDETIHIFAQQVQQEGKNQSRSVFFEGKKIYSYGYHYLLGEFIDNNTILINDKGYSVTTSKHINSLIHATQQYKQFYITKVDIDIVHETYNTLLKKITRARKTTTKNRYIREALSLEQYMVNYHKYINNKEALKNTKYKSVVKYAKVLQNETQLIDLEADIKEADKNARAFKKSKTQEQIKKFYNGSINYINNINKELLRLSKNKDSIETSRGANVPLKEAKILYNRIINNKDIKGLKIGYYTIIGIKDNILKIGCHNIELKEVHKLKEVLI